MEALNDRFNALQDKLMDIYESGKDDLETQIEHWKYLRQEQVLYYYARKKGVLRLGYQPIPTLAISETKAKEAIGMMLTLESLQKSEFGKEPWTLVNTSLETYRTPPINCFKKGPINIEVRFDEDPENIMLYTSWTYIYFLDSEDHWQKVKGEVDYLGAFYKDGPHKHYYINFNDDALRYGTSGQWEVRINNETVFAPVTSSTPPAAELRGSSNASPVPAADHTRSQTPTSTTGTTTTYSTTTGSTKRAPELASKANTRKRRYGRKDSSPTATSRKEVSRRRSRSSTRTRGTSRAIRVRSQRPSRSRSRSRSRDSRESRGSTSSRGSSSCRGERGRGGRGRRAATKTPTPSPHKRAQRRSRSRGRGTGAISNRSGISPDKVGSAVQTVSGRHLGRLGRLLAEASDPPVILLRGDPNILKCFRYRDKKNKKGLVKCYSTTWSWVHADGNDRIGRARMLLGFTSEQHRAQYISSMKLPKGVEWSYGNFDRL